MDKKTLPLLIVLIVAVVLYWPALEFFGLTETPESTQTTATDTLQYGDTQSGEHQPEPTTAGASSQAETPDVAISTENDTTAVDTIVVETNKYVVTLTSRGGGAVSLLLKEHTYRDGGPIEMIQNPDGAVPEATFAGGSYSTSNLHFVPSSPSGHYYATSSQVDLEFVYTNADGGQIIRKFSFLPDEYHYDFDMQVVGRETFGFERRYGLAWNVPLGVAEPIPETDYDAMEAVVMMGGEREALDDFKDDPVGQYADEILDQALEGNTSWAGVRNKYFAAILIPQDKSAVEAFAAGSKQEIRIGDKNVTQRKITAGMRMPFANVPQIGDRFRVFVGPLDYMLMSDYDVDLEDMLDIGTTPVVGWIIKPNR